MQGIEEKFILSVIKEREQNGFFADIHDFISRTKATREQLTLLIRTGAFSFTGKRKPELLWEALAGQNTCNANEVSGQLFALPHSLPKLPVLTTSVIEDAYDEMNYWGSL